MTMKELKDRARDLELDLYEWAFDDYDLPPDKWEDEDELALVEADLDKIAQIIGARA